MPRVEATLEIAAPVDEVFAVVATPERRASILPDNFTGFQMLPGPEQGAGARYSFIVGDPEQNRASEVEVENWDPPHGLTERVSGRHGYTMDWRFATTNAGATRVTLATVYTAGGSPLHKLVDRFFARKALHSGMMVELYRLQSIFEGEVDEEAATDESSPEAT